MRVRSRIKTRSEVFLPQLSGKLRRLLRKDAIKRLGEKEYIGKIDPRIHVGEEYGIFKITDVLDEKDKYKHWIYVATCKECGYKKYSHYGAIKESIVNSCKHVLNNGEIKIFNTKWTNKRIENIFRGMKERCYNANNKSYVNYGRKGIKICDEWLENPMLFEDWSRKNGYEDGFSIDRIDCNKDYCPENCRWVSFEDNSKYKSTTSLINVDGEIHTGRDWARELGIGVNTVNKYIQKYGIENTVAFIKAYKDSPQLHRKSTHSYYDTYMKG